MSTPDRRRFLSQLLGGAAATFALPGWLAARTGAAVPGGLKMAEEDVWSTSLSRDSLGQESMRSEEYWRRVKDQFSIAPGLILMNAANLCPSPYPVQQAVFDYTRDVDRDASFQNRGKFSGLTEEARAALASYVGADVDEIAITRNTSEGNNAVVNGLELGPGDEVVLWDQNHPTNNVSWDVRARRWGYAVVRVSTPAEPEDPAALVDAFLAALTPRTRVLSFSHVSNVSGVALPAEELCAIARERGILTLVDGAQTFGAMNLDLHQMGCDFFTSSSHKWFVGPKEAGIMFVRRDSQARLWPSDVGVGWEGASERGAQKFDNLGQRDDAAVVTMATAAAFHEALGPDAVEVRVRMLATSLMEGLREAVPALGFHTPSKPALRCGVVVASLPDGNHREVFEAAYESHKLAGAAMGGTLAGLRLSPHIYNSMDQVERAVEAVASYC